MGLPYIGENNMPNRHHKPQYYESVTYFESFVKGVSKHTYPHKHYMLYY